MTKVDKDWLASLAASNSSSDEDSAMMQWFLREIDFPKAVVVLGVVYMEGRGTIESRPESIHDVAKALLAVSGESRSGRVEAV